MVRKSENCAGGIGDGCAVVVVIIAVVVGNAALMTVLVGK